MSHEEKTVAKGSLWKAFKSDFLVYSAFPHQWRVLLVFCPVPASNIMLPMQGCAVLSWFHHINDYFYISNNAPYGEVLCDAETESLN